MNEFPTEDSYAYFAVVEELVLAYSICSLPGSL